MLKLTELRKQTRNLTSSEIEKGIENLYKILEDKKADEEQLLKEVLERESVRMNVIETLESNNLPVPTELKKAITLDDVRPRRRNRRKKADE